MRDFVLDKLIKCGIEKYGHVKHCQDLVELSSMVKTHSPFVEEIEEMYYYVLYMEEYSKNTRVFYHILYTLAYDLYWCLTKKNGDNLRCKGHKELYTECVESELPKSDMLTVNV